MAVLSIPQAGKYAKAAGFTGDPLDIIVAIAIAESGLDTHAINSHDPNGGSFGVLQINGAHFGDHFGPHGMYIMSQQTAFDPGLSFLFGWELSDYGKNFRPWGTYTNGAYQKYVAEVRAALNDAAAPLSDPFPPYHGEAWYNFNIYSDYPWSTYHNTDVGTPLDTPITASLAGKITILGYFPWGGQVTIQVDSPSANNGYKDYFVIHLDAINPNLHVGQHIDAGTFLGYSGGETSTAGLKPLPAGLKHHATSPAHSTGPHLDIGTTNDPFGSLVDNTAKGKAASDHLVLLARNLRLPAGTEDWNGGGGGSSGGGITPDISPTGDTSGSFSSVNPSPLQVKVHNTLVQYPGFFGIAAALDEAEQFPGFINDIRLSNTGNGTADAVADAILMPQMVLQSLSDTVVGNSIPLFVRGTLLLTGMVLIAALMWHLAKPNLEALPQLLSLAAMAA